MTQRRKINRFQIYFVLNIIFYAQLCLWHINYTSAAEIEKIDEGHEINKQSADYKQMILRIISDIYFPKMEKLTNVEVDKFIGIGNLRFTIDEKGFVKEFKLIKSSGVIEFDRLAIKTLMENAPFPSPQTDTTIDFLFDASKNSNRKNEWLITNTNTSTDCIYGAASNAKADLDFLKMECKAFGGYGLFIEGADLRYSPTIEFHGQTVYSHSEARFHDMGSTNLSWVYHHSYASDGNGAIAWKGLIFTLKIAQDNGGPDVAKIFALRLNGPKTCLLGEVSNQDDALRIIKDDQSKCTMIYPRKKNKGS